MEESTSLIQSLFSSNSSDAFLNILETSATLNAMAKTNLFETNPQLAESLLGGTSASTSTETAATTPDSSSSAASSDVASNLLASIEQMNPDLTESLLQMLQPDSTDATSSVTPGSILNLIA
ncbi:MAG: hypothetical protein L7F78_09575 [Syntrophales bacterium LBB04]|nr:hypothetical protein [Syntrophales bacterium LBB04]